jgi:hypothetical protein
MIKDKIKIKIKRGIGFHMKLDLPKLIGFRKNAGMKTCVNEHIPCNIKNNCSGTSRSMKRSKWFWNKICEAAWKRVTRL